MHSTRYFLSYLVQFFLEWETFGTKVVEEIKTHILCSKTFFFFFSTVVLKRDKVDKYFWAGQATDDNMVNGHFMLDNKRYKHTLTICNISYF